LTLRKCIINYLIVMLIVLPFISVISTDQVSAAGLRSTYDLLKDDYPDYVQQLYSGGLTDSQIKAFLSAVETEVNNRGPLTESNFDNVLLNSVIAVAVSGGHSGVVDVLMQMFSGEISDFLTSRTIPSSMEPLRNAVKESLLGSDSGTVPGPGGGAPPAVPQENPITAIINRQLAEGKNIITLQADANENGITLAGTTLAALANAGKELEVVFGGVSFRLPPAVLELGGGGTLLINARPLGESETSEALSNLGANSRLVGPVYELTGSTGAGTTSVEFSRPVTIILSYLDANITGINEGSLDAGYYDENKKEWVKMNGTLDRKNKTVTFTVTHCSKYAVISFPTVKTFTDLTGHWAAGDINKMVALGLVDGVGPDIFAPNRNITRAEFAALLVRALGIEAESVGQSGRFVDVATGKWYAGVINAAAKEGLVGGLSPDTFGPDRPITREQMAVMVGRALEYKGKKVNLADNEVSTRLAVFNDRDSISNWAGTGVAAAVQTGIVGGRSENAFAPKANATRAEGAIMILRMYNQI